MTIAPSTKKPPMTDAARVFERAVPITVSGLEVFVDGVSVCTAPDIDTRDKIAATYAAMQTEREPE